ncbi:MAG TPA: GNAT family N-acetyltransferase [Candidatus Binatia bacterium]|jgi:ribosomal-protein-alanine N-acetyltransferase|nr:GNAT family N-acetyltransferase [Candidatus Binatia bacterium]
MKFALETARLLLRPCTADDLAALRQLWTAPEVRRYLFDDRIISREQAEAMIQSSLASFPTHGFGLWIVHRTGEEAIVGFCGLFLTGDPPEVELLYGIAPSVWGQGLATEAARAVLRYGLEELRLVRITAGADVPNVASLRILAKLGMTFARRTRTEHGEVLYFTLTREAFLNRE